jgi:serpin B
MHCAVSLVLVVLLFAPLTAQDRPPAVNPVAASTLPFGLDIYRAVASGGRNVVLSPYSVTTALAMGRTGAAGETAGQMDRVLHLGADTPLAAHEALRHALVPRTVQDGHGDKARSVPTFVLHRANGLWLTRNVTNLQEDFTARLEKVFAAPAERIDFRDPAAARAQMNHWIKERTGGRLAHVVPEGLFRKDTCLALVCALHFQASWRKPFQKRDTKDGPFHRSDGTTVTARFLRGAGTFCFREQEGTQVIELPYRDEDTALLVILPRPGTGPAALAKSLTAERLEGWLEDLSPLRLAVALPRFTFESTIDLTEALKALGLRDAFDPERADFSGITAAEPPVLLREPLFFGAALHGAWITVDEAGTEAAAATVFGSARTSGVPPPPRYEFVADHPFLFLVRHRATGAILFLGGVEDPVSGG